MLYFAIVLCLVLPRVVQLVASVVVVMVSSVFVVRVYSNRHHDLRYRSDEARSIECQSQELATCCTRVRSTVRSYIVCVLAVDSLLALCECVLCDNGPLTV